MKCHHYQLWKKRKNISIHVKNKELEEKTIETLEEIRRKRIPVNGLLLKNIAIRLANHMNDISFTSSDGWLEKFKTRNNIKFKIFTVKERLQIYQTYQNLKQSSSK